MVDWTHEILLEGMIGLRYEDVPGIAPVLFPYIQSFFFFIYLTSIYWSCEHKDRDKREKIRVGRSKKELTSLDLYSSLGVSRRTLNSINFGGKKGRKEQAGYQKKKKRKKVCFGSPSSQPFF